MLDLLFSFQKVPWIESLLLYFGANDITTIDYTRKNYESPNIKWIHLAQYLSDKVNEHSIYKMISSFLHSADNFDGEYDVVVSHLAIESIGLGRFGEDLYPVSRRRRRLLLLFFMSITALDGLD